MCAILRRNSQLSFFSYPPLFVVVCLLAAVWIWSHHTSLHTSLLGHQRMWCVLNTRPKPGKYRHFYVAFSSLFLPSSSPHLLWLVQFRAFLNEIQNWRRQSINQTTKAFSPLVVEWGELERVAARMRNGERKLCMKNFISHFFLLSCHSKKKRLCARLVGYRAANIIAFKLL